MFVCACVYVIIIIRVVASTKKVPIVLSKVLDEILYSIADIISFHLAYYFILDVTTL